MSISEQAGRQLQSPAQPPPPADDDSGGGGDDREEHKLALLYCLSLFIWARLRALRGLTKLPRGYVTDLLEELEDEGLVSISSDPHPRLPRLREFVDRIKQAISSKRKPMGQQLRISLTEAGWAHPPLVKLLQEDEKERRESKPPRYQRVIFGSWVVVVTALCLAAVGLAVAGIVYQVSAL